MNQLIYIFLLFLLIVITDESFAQSYSKDILTTIKSANCSSKFIENSLITSPSNLKDVEGHIISTQIVPSPFELNSLNAISLSYAHRVSSKFVSSISLLGLGNNNFNNFGTNISLGYFYQDYFFGAVVSYNMNNAKGFSNFHDIDYGLVVSYKVGEKLTAGTMIDRIGVYDNYDYDINNYIESISGLSYRLNDRTNIDVDYHLLTGLYSSFSFGIKHYFTDDVGLSFAYQTVRKAINFDAYIDIGNNFILVLDYYYQTELGHKKILTLSYRIK